MQCLHIIYYIIYIMIIQQPCVPKPRGRCGAWDMHSLVGNILNLRASSQKCSDEATGTCQAICNINEALVCWKPSIFWKEGRKKPGPYESQPLVAPAVWLGGHPFRHHITRLNTKMCWLNCSHAKEPPKSSALQQTPRISAMLLLLAWGSVSTLGGAGEAFSHM